MCVLCVCVCVCMLRMAWYHYVCVCMCVRIDDGVDNPVDVGSDLLYCTYTGLLYFWTGN